MTDTSLIDHAGETLILAMVADRVFSIDQEGRIWRHAVVRAGTVVPLKRRRRAEYPSTNGYLRIRVRVGGSRIRVSAHRVVWRYFHGDIPEGCVVDHKNRKRHDNRPENLEPVTQRINVLRALCPQFSSSSCGLPH